MKLCRLAYFVTYQIVIVVFNVYTFFNASEHLNPLQCNGGGDMQENPPFFSPFPSFALQFLFSSHNLGFICLKGAGAPPPGAAVSIDAVVEFELICHCHSM